MILIYTDKITNCIKFIFNLIFREILRVEIPITSNKEKYLSYDGVKMSMEGSARMNASHFKKNFLQKPLVNTWAKKISDKNNSIQNRKFHTLIKSLADYAEVGI